MLGTEFAAFQRRRSIGTDLGARLNANWMPHVASGRSGNMLGTQAIGPILDATFDEAGWNCSRVK
jgi:hypothetical protein